jgi:hypothetical protein
MASPSTSPGVADTKTMAMAAGDVIVNQLFDESDYSTRSPYPLIF